MKKIVLDIEPYQTGQNTNENTVEITHDNHLKEHEPTEVTAIDCLDPESINHFGLSIQKRISDFSHSILQQVKASGYDVAHKALTDLLCQIKALDIEALASPAGKWVRFWAKLSFFGAYMKGSRKIFKHFAQVIDQLEVITFELNKAKIQLLKDTTVLNNILAKNQDYTQVIDRYLGALEANYVKLTDEDIPKLIELTQLESDETRLRELQVLEESKNQIERRIHDLKLSRLVAMQIVPQFKIIQDNHKVLLEKINSALLNTIPLWKNRISLAISMYRQKKASKLKDSAAESAKMLLNQNGNLNVDALKQVHKDLIDDIEHILTLEQKRVDDENKALEELDNQ